MTRVAVICDRISIWCGSFGAVVLFVVGLLLSYDVCARYFFNDPTIWIHDASVTAQVWFVYLAMAYALQRGEMIRVTTFAAMLGTTGRKIVEAFSLLVIIAISILAVYLMWETLQETIAMGRRQPTMLGLPNWVVELPAFIGFIMLALQALANLVRLPSAPAPDFHGEEEVA